MKTLHADYEALLASQVFVEEELDYGVLDGHVEMLAQLARVSNSGVSVFDMCRRRHVFTSYNFAELFGYDMERVAEEDTAYFNRHIHPGDMPELMRNGTAVLRYFMERSDRRELARTKMINEYRIEAQGRYVRVIEQFRVLEFDARGNVWLSLSVLDVSPNQAPLDGVQSKLMNCRTGAVYLLPEFAAPDAPPAFVPRAARARTGARRTVQQRDIRASGHQCAYGQYAPAADTRKAQCR